MSLPVANCNNVKVYRVGGSARNVTLPEWLAKTNKASLKKDSGECRLFCRGPLKDRISL
jgi:hypothetical protein